MDLPFDSVPQPTLLYGQGWLQIGGLVLAFVLSSVIGLERQWRDKSAGLRIYSSVGTSAALLTLVSKYGFMDVLITGQVATDPARVAAQIVTGVGWCRSHSHPARRGARAHHRCDDVGDGGDRNGSWGGTMAPRPGGLGTALHLRARIRSLGQKDQPRSDRYLSYAAPQAVPLQQPEYWAPGLRLKDRG